MKAKLTRLIALSLSIFICISLFAACGKNAEEEPGSVPVIDLELPATASTEPIYQPSDTDTEPVDVDPSTASPDDPDAPSTEVDPSSEPDGATPGVTTAMAKTTNKVNLRNSASTDGSVLEQLPKGAVVTLLDTSNTDWYKVSYNGKEGYVSAQYLDTNPSSTDMELKGKVTTSSLNIRESASSSANAIGSLAKGDVVTIVAAENGWYKIKHGSGYGYVSADYVSILD